MTKYFYVIFGICALISAVICFLNKHNIEGAVWALLIIIAFGIDDILDELKNNEDVIIRDPKTGRFKKK